MKFDDIVARIGTLPRVRRIASAHVVDHTQLTNDELRGAVIKVKPQYLHRETVANQLAHVLYQDDRKDYRVLARLILFDVLLEQYDFSSPYTRTEEATIACEQAILDRSNEVDLLDLASGDRQSQRFRDLSLYNFVLTIAWENQDTVSPDEANLLLNLRRRLRINEWDHRTLEAKLHKYPKPENELHTRSEIARVRQHLQGLGLLFQVRQDDGIDVDVIPEELAAVMRSIGDIEIRTDPYRELLKYRHLRRKAHLTAVLDRNHVQYGRSDTVDTLMDRVVREVPPSRAIASVSPKYGLNSTQLTAWCRELGISPSGTMDERVSRVIRHWDQLRPTVAVGTDERARWYDFYEELALRAYEALRAQHVIEKDLEVESKFEDATAFLFSEKLNHATLRQSGSEHADGLLSLRNMYLMWDNKSKESPGLVNLRDHIAQFDGYMNDADKPVPVFLVIAPAFTDESEAEANRYHAEYFDRNVVLITAGELKELAEEWSDSASRNREEPFPLALLAATGRFNRQRLGKLG